MLHKLKISNIGSESTFLCKSCRDDILLTVCFNLRNKKQQLIRKSCKDDTLSQMLYRPCGTSQFVCYSGNRRLKSTVNRVPSLRDLPFDMGKLRNMNFKLLNIKYILL
jgi:hypothetical protein